MVFQTARKETDNCPLCSVCVANYNGEECLSSCLDSVLNQENFPGMIEIVVHDDASTDGSVALLKKKYPQVKVLLNRENVGFCISNNRMVAVAEGKFVLLLNNDAVLHKDALATLYDASLKYGDGIFGLPQYNVESRELIDIGSTFDLFLNPIPNKNTNRQDVGMIIGACLWLPKRLWDELEGFPEWFGSLAEDMYLCCRARLWGYPVKALHASGFDHWVGRSLGGGKVTENNTLSTTVRRRALSERNKTFVMLICYPTSALLFLFPIHILLLCLEGTLLTFVKRDKRLWSGIYWNCIKEVYRNKGILWEIRRKTAPRMDKSKEIFFFEPFTVVPHKLFLLLRYGLPKVV